MRLVPIEDGAAGAPEILVMKDGRTFDIGTPLHNVMNFGWNKKNVDGRFADNINDAEIVI